MIRYLINKITIACGWSPVGKNIRFISGEGPLCKIIKNKTGIINCIAVGDEDGSELIFVKVNCKLNKASDDFIEVILAPRHRGYGSVSLATTCISVYVYLSNTMASDIDKEIYRDDVLAMMDVCLDRNK